MNGEQIDVHFSGDRGDPWVRELLAALPDRTSVTAGGPELPSEWEEGRRPDVVMLHRANLNASEPERLRALCEGGEGAPRVILITGRHVRYHHLMAWSGLADVVLPEATARESIARHLVGDASRRGDGGRRRVAVASDQHELTTLIEDALTAAGYVASRCRGGPDEGQEPWIVWDVPVLDPGWTGRLAGAARRRGVVALLGLADRETVAAARSSGAVACLDLPCDPDDLVFVLDRLTRRGGAPGRPANQPAHAPPFQRPRLRAPARRAER